MKLGIVIPHLNSNRSSFTMLRRCLKSIRRWEPLLLKHTYIIDDVSPEVPDVCYDQLEQEFGCKVILKTYKESFSSVVNLGASILNAQNYTAMILLNNDIELTSPCYLRAGQILRFDPKIAVIGALLLYPNGKVQHAGFKVLETSAPFEYSKNVYLKDTPEALKPRFIYGVTGAYQVVRLSAFDEIGGYDERFSLSYEDVEFCGRVWMNGYKVFYDPHLKAIHSESVTRGYFLGERELKSLETWHQVFQPAHAQQIQSFVSSASPSNQ
jgi:GT2 family glycosyltransferase